MKTILITGSTDGIGKLTGIQLAQAGHNVYLHGRSQEKLDDVIREVKSLSQNENVRGYVADFSDLDAVAQLASQITADLTEIDVLINNAGVFNSPSPQNKDGLDMRFVVNYFAPYMLTNTLLPLLEQRSGARIINLSSAAQAPVSAAALKGEQQLPAQASYAQSKLALTMWSFDLAKRFPELDVIAVNPGSLLNTKMVREAFGQHWSSADKGANILRDLATSDEYQDVTGKYFDNDKGEQKGSFGEVHPDAYNESKINQLIKETEAILGRG